MKKLKITILSWLLHHANKYDKSEHFYLLKRSLLKKYGGLVGYDVQEIEGKKCFTCNGTGIYIGYLGRAYQDTCRNCYGGWYKRPEWNTLQLYKFGKYLFHVPHERLYYKPAITSSTKIINGYISHNRSYWSHFARVMIFMLLDFKGYGKRWWFNLGAGWCCNTFNSPRTFINNVCHILRNGYSAIPFSRWRQIQRAKYKNQVLCSDLNENDLPF